MESVSSPRSKERANDVEAGQSASEREGKLDLYSVIFLFSSVSLNYGLQHPVCLYSTKQHLMEEYIYKPSASGAIKHDWYPECFGPSQLYVS